MELLEERAPLLFAFAKAVSASTLAVTSRATPRKRIGRPRVPLELSLAAIQRSSRCRRGGCGTRRPSAHPPPGAWSSSRPVACPRRRQAPRSPARAAQALVEAVEAAELGRAAKHARCNVDGEDADAARLLSLRQPCLCQLKPSPGEMLGCAVPQDLHEARRGRRRIPQRHHLAAGPEACAVPAQVPALVHGATVPQGWSSRNRHAMRPGPPA